MRPFAKGSWIDCNEHAGEGHGYVESKVRKNGMTRIAHLTFWVSQLTGEDKLLSMLKVTGSFCKDKKKKREREMERPTSMAGGERVSVRGSMIEQKL